MSEHDVWSLLILGGHHGPAVRIYSARLTVQLELFRVELYCVLW